MTQMDKSTFPEPTKFDPNRFENKSSVPPYCFVAFGGGTHICPGNEFARIETLITIHYLVTRFTWKLCADNSFSRDPMPVPAQGLPVRITQKKSLWNSFLWSVFCKRNVKDTACFEESKDPSLSYVTSLKLEKMLSVVYYDRRENDIENNFEKRH